MTPRSYMFLPLVFAAALLVVSSGPALADASGCGPQRVLVFDPSDRLYICIDRRPDLRPENVQSILLQRKRERRVRRLQAEQRSRAIRQGLIGRQRVTDQRQTLQRENLRRRRPAVDNEVKIRVQTIQQRQEPDAERRRRAGREGVRSRELTDRLQEQTQPLGELRRDQLRNSEQAREQRAVQ